MIGLAHPPCGYGSARRIILLAPRERSQSLLDAKDHIVGVAVRPVSEHGPAQLLHSPRCICITGSISGGLGFPIVSVTLGRHIVLRAAMPEAAVYEDDHPLSREGDVRAPATVERKGPIHTESIALRVQFAANRELRVRVTTPIGLHVPANRRRSGPTLNDIADVRIAHHAPSYVEVRADTLSCRTCAQRCAK